jgi:S-(hydroxymethyl)glutathione dehydrogenase/alcohol dehydrogenase
MDFAIEASGRIAAMEAAFACVRDGGGLCVIAGNPPFGERLGVDPMDLIRGKRLLGSWGGDTRPDRDIPRFAELYRSGRWPLEELITHRYPLAGINQALQDLEQGSVARALLAFQDA